MASDHTQLYRKGDRNSRREGWTDRVAPVTLLDWINSIADRGREILELSGGSPFGGAPSTKTLLRLCSDLMSRKGEATGTALAREVISHLSRVPENQHRVFFEALVRDYSADRHMVSAAFRAYDADPSESNLTALNRASEPRRQELLRRINMAPEGTRAIVSMRSSLLKHLRERPDLEPLDADMQHLLASWFNRGFLDLRRINWSTSAAILEKLMRYEAVHEIKGWDDLRRRLAADRRCFAFFHPAMADEPLIFVEVALGRGMASDVQAMLRAPIDPNAVRNADTATFYSISNCQQGLRGISFGNFLIKQVVEELRRDLPSITNYATLSPIPGFLEWLCGYGAGEGEEAPIGRIKDIVATLQRADWHRNPVLAEELKEPLLQLCAYYLIKAKEDRYPADPVARFHLGNGAVLERLNWLGDISPKGLQQSAGITANYVYQLSRIERNHEAFANEGRIARSRAIGALVPA